MAELGILVLYVEVEGLNVGFKVNHHSSQVLQVAKSSLTGSAHINVCACNYGTREDQARHPAFNLVCIHEGGYQVPGLVGQQVPQADSGHD